MKTKRILTLLIALMVGVMLNAQGFIEEDQAYLDKMKQDNYQKVMWWLEYGGHPSYLISLFFLSDEPERPVKETPPHRVVGKADSSPYKSNVDVHSRVPHFKDNIGVRNYSKSGPGSRY